MNYVIARGSSNFRQNGSVLDKVEKLHLKRSSLSPESSTVVHRRLFNLKAKAKEKSICCSWTLMLADIESVYFAACNLKTTEKSGLNLGIFKRVCKNFRME